MKIKQIMLLGILVLLSTSCNFPEQKIFASADTVRAWIDAPLDGSQIPFGDYEIVYHGTAPDGVSQTELIINGKMMEVLDHTGESSLIHTMSFTWQPADPGNYLIQTRSMGNSGEWSEYAQVEVTVGEPPPATRQVTPSPTPTMTPSPTRCVPMAILNVDSNCRSGPGLDYESQITLSANQEIPIEGQNRNSNWWLIHPPDLSESCWVSASTVETTCLGDGVAQIDFPPMISEPSAASTVVSLETCDVQLVRIDVDVISQAPISFVEIHFRVSGLDWMESNMEYVGENTFSIQMESFPEIFTAITKDSSPLSYYILAVDTDGLSTTTNTYQNVTIFKSKCH